MKKSVKEQRIVIVDIEKPFCDVKGCSAEAPHNIKLPVIFHTEQTEGIPVTPYVSYETLDLCEKHFLDTVKLNGHGAQGRNTYFFK